MYATITELKAAIGNVNYAVMMSDIIDEDDQEQLLTDVLTHESNAIDDMIRNRVTLPLTTTNTLIKDICLKMAVFEMWKRQALSNVPEVVLADKKEAWDNLRKINEGKLEVTIPVTEGETETKVESSFYEAARVFSTNME